MKRRNRIFLFTFLLVAAACSTTRSLKNGEYLLRSNSIKVNEKNFDVSSLQAYVYQKPNTYILGLSPFLSVYNWGGQGETGFQRFLQKLGTAPVIYDAASVEHSVENLTNHLSYIGYYGSQVESDIQVKGRKVYVTYYVLLGKQYEISAIDYQIPSYGTFREEFDADLKNTTVHPGSFLSESSLEAEADRSAQYFRNLGYYGFNKRFFAFEADTLGGDNKARLTYSIRDYALGDTRASAKEHKKFTLNEVTVSHPTDLHLRKGLLENLNTLRPGQLYNEKEINTTYSRYTGLSLLSAVSINMTPVSDNRVDCNIGLRGSSLQGFKTNLEASVNSTGLVGISPQLTYYHRNLFHGGELFNLGVKGNFQFRPGQSAYSTDVSVSASLRFPQFIGLPVRVFKGPNIPHTDVSAAFVYQNRPEFHRTVISTAFSYNGRLGTRLFYQVTPFRANISRLFDIDPDFLAKIVENPYMLNVYADNFDMGVSGMLYYTTDASAVPNKPYHYARLNLDLSGNVLSLFNGLMPQNGLGVRTIWNTPYAQYVRGELHLGKTFRFGPSDRQALALHLMGGAAYAYGNSLFSAPMDRLFFVGGSSSMRGWQARTLGPGNADYESIKDIFKIPSQMGDMKLEANIEYRAPLFWKLEGALFADAGNIWDWPLVEGDKSGFQFKTLGESIGLDWGVGIRLNLDFILIRVDWGMRVHDPGLKAGERWVAPRDWFKGASVVHFGVGYPF